ncbi:hypothetical protein GCM10009776_34840 [Microbacterium deminutum]|uniref:Uncharacterized protein n=1 Tax=Microbacterium deminutum TaxID=344164 RepID=A0ABP5CTU9_9MICO
MRSRGLLLAISVAQLAVGVTGQVVAIRQGRSFDIFRWHGDPRRVAKDSWFLGTGLSAPIPMMAVHACAIAVLGMRPSRRAAGTLGTLGAAMTAGYLIENQFRTAMRHPGHDRVVPMVGGGGFLFAVVMAVIGLREARSTRFSQRNGYFRPSAAPWYRADCPVPPRGHARSIASDCTP